MHKELNKPIFVVGSPRSGTSIPVWCPGRSAYFENQAQTLFDVFKRGRLTALSMRWRLGTGLICSKNQISASGIQ